MLIFGKQKRYIAVNGIHNRTINFSVFYSLVNFYCRTVNVTKLIGSWTNLFGLFHFMNYRHQHFHSGNLFLYYGFEIIDEDNNFTPTLLM